MHAIELGGRDLTLEDLAPVLGVEAVRAFLGEEARRKVAAARRGLETRIAAGEVVYGANTGFGRFSRVRISSADARTLQRNLLLSHACGIGEPLPRGETRLAFLLRLQALAQGRSGVRPELLERLLALFNAGVVPVVPSQGSVGASGDLAPLSHLALPLLGLGEAWVGEERMDGVAALARLGLPPFELEAKEGLSLINGTQVSTAVGIAAAQAARNLSKASDAIGALTLEALKGSSGPFDERLARLRPHPGQARAAANLRRCLEGSEVLPSHRDCDKVQDAYSLRCMPQVHGAAKDALRFAVEVLEREANAVTDNPVVLEEGEVVNGGNFHGQPVASALDFLSIALATWANVAERRVEQLVNPDLSGLPAFLTRKGGLNSGLMVPQVVAAAIVSEGKTLAHPASVDSIPTSAAREDFVPMSLWAARKARRLAENAGKVLGIEALCAAQAREFTTGLRAGRGAEAACAAVRTRVAPLGEDRLLAPDVEAAADLVASGALVEAVEREVGPLEW
ncbi:MAG TPA: histidine ammonia-lyase [Planctomycetota bacterium]|nr:histidine ammonia-lyase [Planctomycetota bacterium]